MPTVHVIVHPRGLHPVEAARSRQLHAEEGMVIQDVCDEVVNLLGEKPSVKAVWRAIHGVEAVRGTHAIPQTKCLRMHLLACTHACAHARNHFITDSEQP